MTASVDIPIPATPGAASRAVDGPRWVPNAVLGDTQTDGRGVRWVVDAVQQGGRVLVWFAWVGRRTATTTVVEGHPDYPSDAAMIEVERERRRAAKARMRAR